MIERGAWYFAPFSWIYAVVISIRNFLYDKKIFPAARVDALVISVGNIVAGGTGKTPFVLLLAKTLLPRKVAILTRGYGGDEPLILARRLPQVPIYVGKDRVHLAKQAIQEGAGVLILDDGFQYRKLSRDLDIVLLDGREKGHYLPWGFLRDSPKRLQQAGALFVQGKDYRTKVSRILDFQEREIPSIRGWKIGFFCGIARPEKFRQTLTDLGAEIVSEWILADHEAPSISKLKTFAKGLEAILCTEKDFVKLPKELSLPIYFVEIEAESASYSRISSSLEGLSFK